MTTTEQKTEGKEFSNIDPTNDACYKTIRAWKAENVFAEHKLPVSEYGQMQRLRKFDSIVQKDKGIQKIIHAMIRQVVKEKDKTGRTVATEYLTLTGEWKGQSWTGEEYSAPFEEGVHKVPHMIKLYEFGKKFDSDTGKDLGRWEPSGSKVVYTILVPEDKVARKKLIDSIIKNSP